VKEGIDGHQNPSRIRHSFDQSITAASKETRALPHNVKNNPRLVALEGDAPDVKGLPLLPPPELPPFELEPLGEAPPAEEKPMEGEPPPIEVGSWDGGKDGGSKLTDPLEENVGTGASELVPPIEGVGSGPVEIVDFAIDVADGIVGPVPVGGNVQTVPSKQQPGTPSTDSQNSVSSQHPPAPAPVQQKLVTGQQNPTGSTQAAKPTWEQV